MEKEDMECQGELISEKVEEHEYHTNRPKVSNSIDRNWTVNDGNSRKLWLL